MNWLKKNHTNIPRSHRSYKTHYLHIYLHNIRTLSSAETRAVCQNVYGVPRALYCRQRIGYTMYMYTVYIHRLICSLSLSVTVFLSFWLCVYLSVSFSLSVSPPFSLYPRQNVPVRTYIPSALLCAHISRISTTEIVWPHSKDTPSGVLGPAGEERTVQCMFSVLTTYIHVRSLSNTYLQRAIGKSVSYILWYIFMSSLDDFTKFVLQKTRSTNRQKYNNGNGQEKNRYPLAEKKIDV